LNPLSAAQRLPATTLGRSAKPQNRDFIRVGTSRIEGMGVFAKRKIPKGSRIIEYLGRRLPVGSLLVPLTEGEPTRTYSFRVNETTMIDGTVGGNDARFINHSCEPNCEAYVFDDRVYIYAMRDILRNEELTFDYKLGPARKGAGTKFDKTQFACHCGSTNCRGTMLAVKA
jgi:SET domain-containing protein